LAPEEVQILGMMKNFWTLSNLVRHSGCRNLVMKSGRRLAFEHSLSTQQSLQAVMPFQ
jgi:hypothetical protein